MSRLHTIGYEMNDTNFETGVTYAGTPVIGGSPVRTGSYALQMTYQDIIGYNVSGATRIYMGFGFYDNSVTSALDIVAFWSTTGALAKITVGVGGALEIYRGTSLLATSSNVVTTGGWHYIELDYYPDQASGVVTIRVNGAEWATVTADTMDNANALATVRFSCPASGMSYSIDDLIINSSAGAANNTWPGQQKLYLALPNAAGDSTDLTPSTGANYAAVDEIPPATADYVSSATATDYDLYNITDPLAGTETISSVVINIVAKLDSGTGDIAATLKAGATEADGADIALTEAWALYQTIWNTNPDDSAAWAPTDIDGLQIGVEVKA
jgi:hypothetical protein